LVFCIAFVPLFFPRVPFLAMAPMMLGNLEVVAHTGAIWMFHLESFYSPGLATAVFVLMPVSIYGIAYAVGHRLMSPRLWLFAFIYMLGALVLAQQIVVRASGMDYSEFLRNMRATIFSDAK
jgi:hypothetical protein